MTIFFSPLLYNNKFVIDFKQKSQIFSSHFFNQYSPLPNSSNLPLTSTNNSLNSFKFNTDDIKNVRKNQNPNNDYGHDMISFHMIKIWGNFICKPLEIIYNACLGV